MNGTIKLNRHIPDGKISLDEVLQSFSALDTNEVVQMMHEMGKMLAQRKSKGLLQRESELLKAINQSIASKLQIEYEALNLKLNEETINSQEYQQLLKIVEKMEHKKARKLEYMLELAQIRNVSLKELAAQLKLNSEAYA